MDSGGRTVVTSSRGRRVYCRFCDPVRRVAFRRDEWIITPRGMVSGGLRTRLDGYRHIPVRTVDDIGIGATLTLRLIKVGTIPRGGSTVGYQEERNQRRWSGCVDRMPRASVATIGRLVTESDCGLCAVVGCVRSRFRRRRWPAAARGPRLGSVDEGDLEVWFRLVGSLWLPIGTVRLDRFALIVRHAVSISLRPACGVRTRRGGAAQRAFLARAEWLRGCGSVSSLTCGVSCQQPPRARTCDA